MQGWDLKGPLENIVASSAYAVARFRYSLFSPLSRSLLLALRAVALQAHDLLVGREAQFRISASNAKRTPFGVLCVGCRGGI